MSNEKQKKPFRPRPEQIIHIQLPETEVRRRVRRGFWFGVRLGVVLMGVVTVVGYALAN